MEIRIYPLNRFSEYPNRLFSLSGVGFFLMTKGEKSFARDGDQEGWSSEFLSCFVCVRRE